MQLLTPRLCFRPWRESDLASFAAMNADPEVRRYFPGTQTRQESDASVARFRRHEDEQGFTFQATELRESGQFIGFVGLMRPGEGKGFPPGALEAGWRLDRSVWGQGLATEGARAWVDYAFRELGVPAVGAITTVENMPSRRVMEKLGMEFVREFLHPDIDPAHPIAPHVLYLTPTRA